MTADVTHKIDMNFVCYSETKMLLDFHTFCLHKATLDRCYAGMFLCDC